MKSSTEQCTGCIGVTDAGGAIKTETLNGVFENNGIPINDIATNGIAPRETTSNRAIANGLDHGKPLTMPLAIVGMAGRFAGGISGPEALWDFVAQGKSAWSSIPKDRFNLPAFHHEQSDRPGTTHVRGGYFLQDDVGYFDHSFFNLSANTAAALDPQIRMMMELTFEAFESAGITLRDLAGSNTSVFAGTFTKDYHDMLLSDPETIPAGLITGNYSAMVANRLSHFFDLKGPSVGIDTGCSTSLMSLHLACQSLRAGESDCSIVSGACLNLSPDSFANLASTGAVGPEAKCFAFDHRAEGYGRGEGVATLIIKRLDDALQAGDPIRAVIRETAVNQDGRTTTITSPDETAQYDLINACYKKAGLDPLETVLVEAHGTGTKVGDSTEAAAIGRALRPAQGRDNRKHVYLASVKTNIGHTEAVSGLAALIKIAKSLEEGQIAPSNNFDQPPPGIDLEGLGLQIPSQIQSWPPGLPRRASINNFGYGGTNTHVILEASPRLNSSTAEQGSVVTRNDVASPKLVVLSARDEQTVRKMATNLKHYLEQYPKTSLSSIAYTLGQRRSRFRNSIAFSVDTVDELFDLLSNEKTLKPVQTLRYRPRLGFVFNGQGAQHYSMGRELMSTYPVYLQTLHKCDEAIRSFGAHWSLIDELQRDEAETKVHQVQFSMPLTCAVQLSLVSLLNAWGIKPVATTGHSTGEIAAAYAAGAISLEEAMAASYFRGLINSKNIYSKKFCHGGMLAVGLGIEQVEPYIGEAINKVVVACYNSHSSVTLSGDLNAIESIEQKLKDEGIFARKLHVQAAFHSHHMIPLAKDYRDALKSCFNQNRRSFHHDVSFFSSVTGDMIEDAEELGPTYWVDNMLQPVLFDQSFSHMVVNMRSEHNEPQAAVDVILEIGPHAALAGPIRQLLNSLGCDAQSIGYTSCLERNKNSVATIQNASGKMLQLGYQLEVEAINSSSSVEDEHLETLPNLPAYPWNHEIKLWAEPRRSRDHRHRKYPYHDLLGIKVPGISDQAPIWRHILKQSSLPWIQDHVVQSQIVYPGAGYIAMAIEAARQLHESKGISIQGYLLRDVEISRAVIVSNSIEGVEIQISFELPDERFLVQGWYRFRICSTPDRDSPWHEIATGLIFVRGEIEATLVKEQQFQLKATSEMLKLMNDPSDFFQKLEPKKLFGDMRQLGIRHGPLFQNFVGEIMLTESKSLAKLSVSDLAATMPSRRQEPHVIHPVTLDSVFLAAYSSLYTVLNARTTVGAAVPRSIGQLYISSEIDSRSGQQFKALTTLLQHSKQGFDVSTVVRNAESASTCAMIEIQDMHFESIGHPGNGNQDDRELTLVTDWKPSFSLNDKASLMQGSQTTASEDEVRVSRHLLHATYHLISDALAQLTNEDVVQLEWHHKKLYDWMKRFVQQAASNMLDRKSSQWSSVSEGIKQTIIDRVETSSVNGALSVRVGKNLVGILRKEIAPLELMLQDQLLYTFYQECLHFPRSAAHVAAIVHAMAEENPRLRILEIGAGTGGCTLPVLQAIGQSSKSVQLFEHYTFTDISKGFFHMAREKLSAWDHSVSFNALDIEQDPLAQGFELSSYDVIIAAQVLHATKNMSNTMKNVRSLLKEDGKLVLVETIRDRADVQLVFGTLPGWWLSEEQERQDSPNMSLNFWDACLRKTGFSGVDLNIWDCPNEDYQCMSCIVSSAQSTTQACFDESAILVYGGSSPPAEWTQKLVSEFSSKFRTSLRIGHLTEFVPTNDVCIFLSGLNGTSQTFGEAEFDRTKQLLTQCKGLIWVTAGSAVDCEQPENALHLGLLRTARVEDTMKRYVSLDLDTRTDVWTSRTCEAIQLVFQHTMDWNISTTNMDFEYAVRDSKILVPRMSFDAQENTHLLAMLSEREPEMFKLVQNDRPLRLDVDTPGLLDSIVFRDNPEMAQPLAEGFIEVEPCAFGVNFRDIMGAMGMLKEAKQEFGVECAGYVTAVGNSEHLYQEHDLKVGDRVSCLTLNGNFGNRVRTPWTSVVRISTSMSFETAASFPVAFVTAYHSLFNAGYCAIDDALLIHAATGGVGQACIILAKWKGIKKILVTAGTPEKRKFLVDTFKLPPDHVFSSRDTSFVQGVLAATHGRGVDIVINSLTGQLLHESWNLLAQYGRFIEIGKRDIYENKSLEMGPFRRAASFIHVDMKQMGEDRRLLIQQTFRKVHSLLASGAISHIEPVVSIPLAEASRAFRMMQAGKHMGKIVLTLGENDVVKAVPSLTKATLRSDATYMIVGGMTGIGHSVAKCLANRGASNLLLVSRNATTRKHNIRSDTIKVIVRDCDVANVEALRHLIEACYASGMPEIRGVVYGGMVLDDAILEHMNFSQWSRALRPKYEGTRNIHDVLGNSLDFFVMLSSICGILGNSSQANYAAGNTYQDALARHRNAKGLPATTIDVGVVEGVGYVADQSAALIGDRLMKVSGHRPLTEAEIIGLVEQAICKPHRLSRTSQITTGMSGSGAAARSDPRFAMLHNTSASKHGNSSMNGGGPKAVADMLAAEITQAESAGAAEQAVQKAITTKLCEMFGMTESEVDASQPLASFGVDSLVAVELRNWLVSNARIDMSIFELLASVSLADLASKVVARVTPTATS